jgi:hypothetical protein
MIAELKCLVWGATGSANAKGRCGRKAQRPIEASEDRRSVCAERRIEKKVTVL